MEQSPPAGAPHTQPVGLVARWETKELPVEVEYRARFRPTGDADELWFRLDELIGQFLSGKLSVEDVRERVTKLFDGSSLVQDVPPLSVAVERLWQLRHYVRAYQLLEKDVFCYA